MKKPPTEKRSFAADEDQTAAEAVEDMRRGLRRAHDHVRQFRGLMMSGGDEPPAPEEPAAAPAPRSKISRTQKPAS